MRRLASMDSVSKVYPRVHQPLERLRAFSSLLLGREPRQGAEVLSDVSLEVLQGESLGIIGENGAGKSTLLKLLTGVIRPTRGSVTLDANAAALLELGAGFHPDFSGLDNVRMKASLLGLGRRELQDRLDDILSFADIGEYIHEPVKHYSSGMVVRLGFSVVAASRPELLITDEVLAVGDESFQKKCIAWIEDFLDNGGTLLMVSHSMFHVQKLCRRAIWLHDGRVREAGGVFDVTQDYLAWHEQRSAREKTERDQASGGEGLYRITDMVVAGNSAEGAVEITAGEDLVIELSLASPDGRAPIGMVGLVRADGTAIYGVAGDPDNARKDPGNGDRFTYRLAFRELPLMPGSYSVRGHVLDPEGYRIFDTREVTFKVRGETRDVGFVKLKHEWLD